MREARPGWWLAGLVLAAVALPTAVSVPVAVLVLTVVGGSRWWVRRAAGRLQASCTAPAWASFDQGVEAVLEVRNQSRLPVVWAEVDLPVGLGLGRGEPYREAVALPPLSATTLRVALRGLQRGRHTVGPPRLRIGDVLGVCDARAPAGDPATITVFPRIVPLDRLGLPAQSPFVTVPSQRSLFVDPTSVVGVRDYQRGDPLSSIHWTATARTRELMVKQYERAEARETIVCLDLRPQGYARGSVRPAVELAVTVAASVLHHSIVAQRLPAGLLVGAWTQNAAQPVVNLHPRTDHAHLRRMLEVLAVAEAGAPLPLSELLGGLGGLAPGTTVLAVTGKLEPGTAAHLIRLAREGVPVAVALTGPSADEDELTVEDLWLPVYRVSDIPEISRLAA